MKELSFYVTGQSWFNDGLIFFSTVHPFVRSNNHRDYNVSFQLILK